jgi:dihydroxyacetone kinase-like protein
MSEMTTKEVIGLFEALHSAIEADKDRLSALDGAIGDADHGITMALGFAAVMAALSGVDADTASPADVFNAAAKSFLNAVGASAGPLYATAFMRAGAAVKGRAMLDRDAVVDIVSAMAKGIADRGKAAPGEKTMLDAWAPAADAMTAARDRGADLRACLEAGAAAAEAGAEATKAMLATKGRAARLGERSLGHMDPGAASAAVILRVMADFWG